MGKRSNDDELGEAELVNEKTPFGGEDRVSHP